MLLICPRYFFAVRKYSLGKSIAHAEYRWLNAVPYYRFWKRMYNMTYRGKLKDDNWFCWCIKFEYWIVGGERFFVNFWLHIQASFPRSSPSTKLMPYWKTLSCSFVRSFMWTPWTFNTSLFRCCWGRIWKVWESLHPTSHYQTKVQQVLKTNRGYPCKVVCYFLRTLGNWQ